MTESGTGGSMALAVIEVRGLINAATVVDAMVKAVDVQHQRSLRVGSGWIAIWVGGELNTVNAAVDAAYQSLDPSHDAKSVVFTLPSDAIRRFMATPVAA